MPNRLFDIKALYLQSNQPQRFVAFVHAQTNKHVINLSAEPF